MSGETESSVSGWTVDTLHQHMQRQISDMQRMLDERHASTQLAMRTALAEAEKAVLVLSVTYEKRFENQNEFRGQLTDQQATLITRVEALAAIERNAQRIDELTAFCQTLLSRVEYDAAHVRLVEQVRDLNERTNTYALRSDVTALTDRMNRSEGKGDGLNAGWVYLLAAVAAIGTIVSIYLALKGG